jgi:pimeloyl-ACP methyl ester carboxylesterase
LFCESKWHDENEKDLFFTLADEASFKAILTMAARLTRLLLLLVVAGTTNSVAAFVSPAVSSLHRPHEGIRSYTLLTRQSKATEINQDESDVEISAVSIDASSISETPKVFVRRNYETFVWTYSDDVSSTPYNINYRVEGPVDGPPLLLVHGFGANVNHFRFQFPTLAASGYRTYAVDLLGFGASDKPPRAAYSIELFAKLLVDFIQAMNAQQPQTQSWIIAGNSIGGLCSLAVANQIPEYIRGVVLFNCAGGMTGFRYEDVPFYLQPLLWFIQNVMLGPQLGGRFFANFKTRQNVESILKEQGVYRNTQNVDEELLELLLGPSEDDYAQDVFLRTFAGPPGPTPESLLPTIDCPILALWGGADPWTPVDAGMHPGKKFVNYARGDFQLQVLEGVGHCPHDEVPELVNEKMIAWMEQLSYEPATK